MHSGLNIEKIIHTFKNIFLDFKSFFAHFVAISVQCEAATLIFEEFIHDFCQRLLFADLHIRNDHTDYLNFKECLHFGEEVEN